MTNEEKLFQIFPDGIGPFCKVWLSEEYREPTTKNDLGVDCISREQALVAIRNLYPGMPRVIDFSGSLRKWVDEYKPYIECDDAIQLLPSVTPQEPRWIPVSEKKPNKGGEYLLWGKIDESEEQDYCFIGDYYEFEEVFGIEESNYDPHTLGFIGTEIEEYYSVVAWMPLPKSYREVKE